MRTLTVARRVTAGDPAARHYGRQDNSRNKAAAETVPPVCRRLSPTLTQSDEVELAMSVPVERMTASTDGHGSPADCASGATTDATAAIRAALALPITPDAFRCYAALVLSSHPGERLSWEQVTARTGLADYSARKYVGELVRVGLVSKQLMYLGRSETGSIINRPRYYVKRVA